MQTGSSETLIGWKSGKKRSVFLALNAEISFSKFKAKEYPFKDIVQPKKRGVERGTIRTVLTSYTIADIF